MAKRSAVERNLKRQRMAKSLEKKRDALRKEIHNRDLDDESRYVAQMKLDGLPKNSCPIRVKNRCQITGRPKGFYRKFHISRIALREMAAHGQLPGVTKASW